MTTIIGLTGGIASGKSTVSKMFAQLNVPIIDADKIAHEVMAPNTAATAMIVGAFGTKILTDDGHIDRHQLGQLVFGHPRRLAKLNKIVQPVIRSVTESRLRALKQAKEPVVVLDAPLLLEQHYEKHVDIVVVVSIPLPTQLQRLKTRDDLATMQAQRRIDSQLALAEKEKLADVIIDNTGSVEATRLQVVKLLDKVRHNAD